ncbi:MAG: tRNA lysidine(34) synthetase TilS, partial [Gemmatimonadota bacterium]
MSALGPRFVRFVRSRGLFRPGDRVLVALSGGVDSVVLLHLLKANEGALELTVHAAHFDHAMRADSAADADWVQQLCANRQIPLVRARATRTLKSEADARFERYRFLQSAARESASARIATAHHAGDQVETVLFRLLRGTGMRGLAGIPLRRGRFVRPLLRFTKPELLAYAAAHDIAYREDPSTELRNYART